MTYKIEFQYKANDQARPYDEVQEDELIFENGEFLPIPDVGDSVSLKWGENRQAFKVLTRHFSFITNFCAITIVVTDMESGEMAARLKE